MKKIILLIFTVLVLSAWQIQAQIIVSDEDKTAIKQTALDYAEGWYEGSTERMERAVHPDLAKRIARKDEKGNSRLENMSAMTLVQSTRRGFGKQTPKEQQQKDLTILDAMENSAVVKLVMRDWVDYMQMAKINNRWVIVNVLWEMKPQKK